MRIAYVALLGAAVLEGSLPAAPASAVVPIETGAPGQQIIEQVADGVYVAHQPDGWWQVVSGNVMIVEQSDGLVLFDAAGQGDGARLVRLIQSISDKPVKAVAISHWHGDHFLGLPRLLEKWPNLRIIATKSTADLMRTKMSKFAPLAPSAAEDKKRAERSNQGLKQLDAIAANSSHSEAERKGAARDAAFIRARLGDYKNTYIVMPTETFTDQLVIPDAERPVNIRYVGRGNTAGDAVAWLPRQHILATGDTVIAPGPYAFNVTPASWIETIQRLKQFPFTTLIPGHGVPQKDGAFLDKMSTAIEEVRAEVGRLAASGMTLEEITKQARFDSQVQSFTHGDSYGEVVFRGYWIEPLISSAYREAKGQPVLEGI